KTFRMRGHEEASGTDYVPAEQLAAWVGRDPIARFESRLDAAGVVGRAEREAVRAELGAEIERALAAALADDMPRSTPEAERARVHGPPSPLRRAPARVAGAGAAGTAGAGAAGTAGATTEMRYVDAVRDALRTALAADERVVLLGQDIAEYGGVFKEIGRASRREGGESDGETVAENTE